MFNRSLHIASALPKRLSGQPAEGDAFLHDSRHLSASLSFCVFEPVRTLSLLGQQVQFANWGYNGIQKKAVSSAKMAFIFFQPDTGSAAITEDLLGASVKPSGDTLI